jgi:hypothetical protein
VGAELFRAEGRTDGRTDGQTDMVRIIISFLNFANMPKEMVNKNTKNAICNYDITFPGRNISKFRLHHMYKLHSESGDTSFH